MERQRIQGAWGFGLPGLLLDFGPLCFIIQEILEHLPLSSNQQDLLPAHGTQTTNKWFADHDITLLDWPANSPDLNPRGNL